MSHNIPFATLQGIAMSQKVQILCNKQVVGTISGKVSIFMQQTSCRMNIDFVHT